MGEVNTPVVNCFNCPDAIEMVRISKDSFTCPICNVYFDLDHTLSIEAKLKRTGYVSLANKDLATTWKKYFRTKYPDIQMVEHGIQQHIYINERGKNLILGKFLALQAALDEELKHVRIVIQKLESEVWTH